MGVDKEHVIKILSETISVKVDAFSDIKETDDLRDWGLDSLKSIDVIVALEDEFNIAIDDDDLLIENFNTVEKILKLIDKYLVDFPKLHV